MTTENNAAPNLQIPTPDVWRCVNLGAGYSEAEGLLRNVNLTIKSGDRVGLLGAPQSGKSLLLRCLVGLRPVRQGELHVFGQQMRQLSYWEDWENIMPQALRRRMGICLEVEGLLSNVTVREGLELLFRFKYGDHTAKLREGASKVVTFTCHRFGLEEALTKRPNMLTAAEKRLSGLARAYLSKPHVVVLENPSQSVGDLSKEILWKALDYVTEEKGRTMVIATEDWALALKYCSRWVVLDQGSIAFDGAPKDFFKTSHPLVESYRRLRVLEKNFTQVHEETL